MRLYRSAQQVILTLAGLEPGFRWSHSWGLEQIVDNSPSDIHDAIYPVGSVYIAAVW